MAREPRQFGKGFTGRYPTSLREGQRIQLPTEVTQQLSGAGACELLLGVAPDVKALVLLPEAHLQTDFRSLFERVPKLNTPEGLRVCRASFRPVTLRKQGRITIPKDLRQEVDIGGDNKNDIIIVAMQKHFEIWEGNSYEAMARKFHDSL